jgi:hypothetical protein
MSTTTPSPLDVQRCANEISQINDQNKLIQNQQDTILTQQKALQINNEAIANIGGTSDDLMNKPITGETVFPPFSLATLSLFLLFVISLITFLYNSVLTRQIMIYMDSNGVIDAMVKSFQTGSFMVDTDGENQTFRYFWDEAMVTVNTYITRGRFFMLVALFMTLLGSILITYSLYYRGQNYQHAAKMISIALSVILGFTFLFMNNQPMTRPFENTIGYMFITYFMGTQIKDCLTGIFSHKFFINKEIFPGSTLYYNFILNTITLNSLPTIFEEVFKNNNKYDFEINLDPDSGINKKRMDNLLKIILAKNCIGNSCWMYFASLVGSMISFQYLLANEL